MTSYLESTEYIGIADIKRVTDSMFPTDDDLANWLTKILLRDSEYFRLKYPGWGITGCEYELEIRHVYTGETRREWVKNIEQGAYDIDDLLNTRLWLIGAESLSNSYYRLFVHDPHWRCPDATNHEKWLVKQPYAQLWIDRLVGGGKRSDWERRIRVQGINPCVYSILEWLMVSDHRLHL